MSKKKKKLWHVTHDMWHVTCDMWHVTHGPGPWESGPCPLDWRTTIPSNVDLVFFPTILTYVIMLENCQNKILVYGCSPIQWKKFYPGWNLMNPGSQSETYRLNELISDKAVSRTAPATPGLQIMNQLMTKLFEEETLALAGSANNILRWFANWFVFFSCHL